MNEQDLSIYKQKLESMLLEIGEYLSKTEESAAAVEPDKGLGRLSRMEAMQDQQMVLELRRRKKRQLLEVKNAISRIEQNLFGKCVFCGKKISSERLNVFPEVQSCVNCA